MKHVSIGSSYQGKGQSYYQRNRGWLGPLLAVFIAYSSMVITPMLFVDPTELSSFEMPSWASLTVHIICALGLVMAGIGIWITDTTSAKILRVLVGAAIIASIVYFLVSWLA